MADKTYEIEIKTTADNSGATSLKEELQATKEEAESTTEAVDGLSESASDIDSSSVEEMGEKMQETDDKTTEASDDTEQLNNIINNIDPSTIDQLAESMNKYSDSAKEGSDSTNDLMEGLVSGGIATGLSSTFMGLADSAGTYNDSMLRMGLALSGHAMTVEQVSQSYGASVSKMAEQTGRSAGSVRNHFANMGVAGINNSKILEDSFQAIATGSFYSGESVESLSTKFQNIVMTGMASRKSLRGLGLTMNDLATTMGVSVDEVSDKFKQMSEEQRASVLSQASITKYGTEVNDVYKNSWEGLWQQFDKAKGGLERLVGELLLPYLIPAVQTATTFINGLADVFKALPQPVKDVMGGILLLMGGITTLGLGLNAVIKVGKLVFAPFQSIGKLFGIDLKAKAKGLASTLKGDLKGAFTDLGGKIKTVASDMKTTFLNSLRAVKTFMTESLIPAVKNAGKWLLQTGKDALIAGYNALKSAGMWAVEKASKLASAVATALVESAQWALNLAMSMNPIMIVVLAIIALITVLGYLYFNNEQVRQAIDGLGQSLWNIGGIIYGYLQQAWDMLMTSLQGFWDYIMTLGGLLPQQVSITGNQIIDGIIAFLVFLATLPIQIGIIFINIIAKLLGFGDNFVQNMIKTGSQSVTNFINYISQIPSKLGAELGNALNKVEEWASTLPQKFWEAGVNAVKQFLSALGIKSPGIIQRKLIAEIENTGDRIPNASQKVIQNTRRMGENIVDAFGNPQLDNIQLGGVEFGNMNGTATNSSNNSANGDIIINVYGDVDNEKRIQQIVDAVQREINWNNATAGRTI